MKIFETNDVMCDYMNGQDGEYLNYYHRDKNLMSFSVEYKACNRFDELDEKCQALTAKMLYKIRCAMPDVDPCKMLDWLYENVIDPEKAFEELVLII